ncbi:MAG TPA: UDP-N-acetylmuramoyl-L-alanine--D-glutamate ligase, partial [Coriobacteriia bacterium]
MTVRDLPPRILVLGLGRSGEAVARYLVEERAAGEDVTVRVVDEGSGAALEEKARALRALGVDVALGVSAVDGACDLVVASPGIPPRSPLMASARALGVEVVSEVELAYRRTRAPFVAVTGTNGKT